MHYLHFNERLSRPRLLGANAFRLIPFDCLIDSLKMSNGKHKNGFNLMDDFLPLEACMKVLKQNMQKSKENM